MNKFAFLVVTVFSLSLAPNFTSAAQLSYVEQRRNPEGGVVTKILDGSLVTVRGSNGKYVNVHILGAEAPLPAYSTYPAECFAEQSTKLLTTKLYGRTVTLKKEDGFSKDSKGNLVRYIYIGNTDVGRWMIANGAAFAEQTLEYSKADDYTQLMFDALLDRKGFWKHPCNYNKNPSEYFQIYTVRKQ